MVAGTPPGGQSFRIAAVTAESLLTGIADRSAEVACFTFGTVSPEYEVDSIVADERQGMATLTQVFSFQVFLKLHTAILLGQIGAFPQVIIETLGGDQCLAPLVIRAVKLDVKTLLRQEQPLPLFRTRLRTSVPLFHPFLRAPLAEQ